MGGWWWAKAPEGPRKAIAARFIKFWCVGVCGLFVATVIREGFIPEGSEQRDGAFWSVVGLTVMSVLTMLWIAVVTLISVMGKGGDSSKSALGLREYKVTLKNGYETTVHAVSEGKAATKALRLSGCLSENAQYQQIVRLLKTEVKKVTKI